jgi:hypothetical protein
MSLLPSGGPPDVFVSFNSFQHGKAPTPTRFLQPLDLCPLTGYNSYLAVRMRPPEAGEKYEYT